MHRLEEQMVCLGVKEFVDMQLGVIAKTQWAHEIQNRKTTPN